MRRSAWTAIPQGYCLIRGLTFPPLSVWPWQYDIAERFRMPLLNSPNQARICSLSAPFLSPQGRYTSAPSRNTDLRNTSAPRCGGQSCHPSVLVLVLARGSWVGHVFGLDEGVEFGGGDETEL